MDATLVALKVEKLGYYQYKGESVAGTPGRAALLKEFLDWGKSKDTIDETKLVTIPHENDVNLGYYYVDGSSNANNDQFTFVMWRETLTDNGNVYGVRKDAEPNKTKHMESANVPVDEFIPGFPSYFWYDAKEEILVNLVFNHSSRSKRHLELFVREFLNKESDFVDVINNIDGEKTFIYPHVDPESNKVMLLHPRFTTKALKVEEIENFLKENKDNIVAIRKDEDLSYVLRTQPEKVWGYMGSVFSFLGADQVKKLTMSQRKFTYEMDWNPEEADIELFLDQAKAAVEGDAIIKDIKLKFKDQSYKSVKDINRKITYSLDIEQGDTEFITADSLLTAMSNVRDEVIEELLK